MHYDTLREIAAARARKQERQYARLQAARERAAREARTPETPPPSPYRWNSKWGRWERWR